MRFGMKTLAAVTMAGAVGCGDATGVQPSDLAGTWTATRFEITSVASGAVAADLIALGGAVSFTIESDGSVTIRTTAPGQSSPDVETGTLGVTGNAFTLSTGGDNAAGTIMRDGDTMTLEITNGIEFDFDDDGTEEAATVSATLTRN